MLNLDIQIINKIKIEVSNRKVKYIDSNTFQGLVNLETIDFNSNQTEEIHEKTFAGLKNLIQINFENNQIKEIHEITFNGLEKLKILTILKISNILHPGGWPGAKEKGFKIVKIHLSGYSNHENH